MRFFVIALLPALAVAFAPVSRLQTYPTIFTSTSPRFMANEVEELANDVTSKAEDVLEKVDNNIVKRGIRLLNHVPIVFTLRELGRAVSSTRFGIDAAPSAFAGAVSSPALLSLPNYVFYAWPLVAIAQLAEVSVSALAGDQSELSQTDITVLSVANLAAAQAIASARPLPWLAAAGILSAYPLRQGGRSSDETSLLSTSFQLMSSFAVVTSLLTVMARASGALPDFRFKGEVVSSAALFLYYAVVNRDGNGLVKRAVNFGTIAAITASRLLAIGGLTTELLSVSLLGAVGVSWVALTKVSTR